MLIIPKYSFVNKNIACSHIFQENYHNGDFSTDTDQHVRSDCSPCVLFFIVTSVIYKTQPDQSGARHQLGTTLLFYSNASSSFNDNIRVVLRRILTKGNLRISHSKMVFKMTSM